MKAILCLLPKSWDYTDPYCYFALPFFLCIYPLLRPPLKINSVQLFVLKASSWKIPHTFLNCKHQKVFSQMFVGKKSQINTSSLMTLIEALLLLLLLFSLWYITHTLPLSSPKLLGLAVYSTLVCYMLTYYWVLFLL